MVGDGRVALVTSAYHMPRALKIARQANLNVGAFPTDWRPAAEVRPSWENWVPSVAAMAWSSISDHGTHCPDASIVDGEI